MPYNLILILVSYSAVLPVTSVRMYCNQLVSKLISPIWILTSAVFQIMETTELIQRESESTVHAAEAWKDDHTGVARTTAISFFLLLGFLNVGC